MSKRILITAIAAGLGINIFLFRSVTPASIALIQGIIACILIILFGTAKKTHSFYSFAGIFILGILTQFRASFLIQFLLNAGMFTLLFYLWYCLVSGKKTVDSFWETITIPARIFGSYIKSVFSTELSEYVFTLLRIKHNPATQKRQHITNIVIGVIAGFPIVGILLILFASADPIFEKTLNQLLRNFSFLNITDLGIRIIVSITAAAAVLPIAFMHLSSRFSSPIHRLVKPEYKTPFTIVMAMIAGTLFLFLSIQWPYVFAHVEKEQSLIQFGVSTYSEYVKRGFFEFLMLASFIYGLIWIGYIAIKGSQSSKKSVLFVFQTIVIFLFMIFLLSVLRRILLYWEFHGLTLIRFYGGLFLIWVGMMTGTMFLRSVSRFPWIRIELAVTLAFLAGISIVNVEEFIVKNHPPTVNNTVDIVYLSRLSADGYNGWLQAYKKADQIISDYVSKTDMLNAEDRRAFSQAGLSLRFFTKQYLRFLQIYGTEAEQKEAAEYIIRMLLAENQNVLTYLIQGKASMRNEIDDIVTIADPYLPQLFGSKYLVIDTQIAQIQEFTNKLQTYLPVQNPNLITLFTIRSSYPFYSFYVSHYCDADTFYYGEQYGDQDEYVGVSRCIPSFYYVNKEPMKRTFLDSFFGFNLREYSVYQQLKKDIPIHVLINTQKNYTHTWNRILQHDPNDRGFIQDVSYESWFIESM